MKQSSGKRYRKKSKLLSIWTRFRRNKLALLGLCMLIGLILVSVFADVIVNYDQAITQVMADRNQIPSARHIFGTDQLGRDMFARIIFGARTSLFVGLLTISIALTFGSVIGAVAGYYGERVDNIIMRVIDVLMAIPSMLLAISVVSALGTGLVNIVIAMSVSQIPRFARIVRSSILSIKGQEFIEAAKACGTSDFRVIFKHIIPNAIGPIIVQATLAMGTMILTVSSLSFVGLGIQPPSPEWGSMLAESKDQIRYFPHLGVIPGLAIITAVLSLNLMGDGLRDALDPRLKN